MKKIILGVDGMKCGMCESHVNDKCRKVNGVKKVKSSHLKNETEIIADNSIVVEDIVKAIEEDGYRITSQNVEDYEKKNLFSFLKK